jgi:hypothetical protein
MIGFRKKKLSSKRTNPGGLLDDFASVVPQAANAVLGVRTTMASAAFSDGAYLLVTPSGTPAFSENVDALK